MTEQRSEQMLHEELFSLAEEDGVELEFIVSKPVYLGEINFEGVENFDETMILMAVRHIVSYLRKPIVRDNFENHNQRRSWRESLPDHLRDLLKNNKLKKSQITIPYTALSSIIKYGEQYPPFREAVATAKKLLPEISQWIGGSSGEVENLDIVEEYDRHTPEQKAMFVTKLEESLKIVLRQLESGRP